MWLWFRVDECIMRLGSTQQILPILQDYKPRMHVTDSDFSMITEVWETKDGGWAVLHVASILRACIIKHWLYLSTGQNFVQCEWTFGSGGVWSCHAETGFSAVQWLCEVEICVSWQLCLTANSLTWRFRSHLWLPSQSRYGSWPCPSSFWLAEPGEQRLTYIQIQPVSKFPWCFILLELSEIFPWNKVLLLSFFVEPAYEHALQ